MSMNMLKKNQSVRKVSLYSHQNRNICPKVIKIGAFLKNKIYTKHLESFCLEVLLL